MEFIFEKEEYYKQLGGLYDDALADLEELKKLTTKGWDSYNADPIDPIAVEMAKMIVGYVVKYLGGYDIFQVFPIHFDGGVSIQIEFEDGEIDREPSYFDCMRTPKEDISRLLNIEVYRDKITLFFKDDIKEESKLKKITKIKDLIEIKNYLDEVFKHD